MTKNKLVYLVLVIYVILAGLTMLFFDGTCDSGDSILHYLFAKYAPAHPKLFFNHWAKPMYVILASPFAQFGFIGVKVFNVILSTITLYYTFKIAEALKLENPIVVMVLLMFSPLNYILTFSGLTEPLFACFLSIGIYLYTTNKQTAAILLLSFLPFIRSEGLIILGVLGCLFLLKRQWKNFPLLLSGHVVMSIAGYFAYRDILWVMNKIPYAHLSTIYGNGEWWHFFDQLIFVLGFPVYFLFWIGCFVLVWKLFRKKTNLESGALIFFSFFCFFIAHSLFWYLGIFNSMGLKRVFIAVMPLMGIIALFGYNFISEELFKEKKKARLILQFLVIGTVLIFPFTENMAAIHWDRQMNKSKDEVVAGEIATTLLKVKENKPCYFYSQPYLSEVLEIDHFDPKQRKQLTTEIIKQSKPGDIIIWENWFAVTEDRVSKEFLDQQTELKPLRHFVVPDDGREVKYSVYKRK